MFGFLLVLLHLGALLGEGQGGEIRRETWPNGRPRAEYEVRVGANGRETRAGPYRAWHENGTLASEGVFADDQETGRWKFTHPNGERAAEGNFARGERTGIWVTYHPNGERRAKGRYEKGQRTGEWRTWFEDGSDHMLESGTYTSVALRLADGGEVRGQRLDGTRHGEWHCSWPDGAPFLSGAFVRDQREGAWRFHNPDGSVAELLSGTYRAGRRIGPLPSAPDPFESPGSLSAFPPIDPGSLGWPAEADAMRAELETWLAADASALDRLQRAHREKKTRPSWVAGGAAALPVVLRRLTACDPESAEDRALVGRLVTRVLLPLCAGHALVPIPEAGPVSPAEARAFLAAWATLWAATRDDGWLWCVVLPLTNPEEREVLRERPFERVFEQLESLEEPPALLARRFLAREGPSEGPLQAALAWLERNQLADGRWSVSTDAEVQKQGEPHDVGITALALLALLGSGRSPLDPVPARAVGWLIRQQDPREGIFGSRRSHAWIYPHAMATQALAEVQLVARSELLRASLQRATDLLFLARNPYGAWRYDCPPIGDADTSVTAWVVTALFLAREAGCTGDYPGAFEGTLAFLEDLTDPASGRAGYTRLGELSARMEKNAFFPRDKGESLTAAALFIRRLLGVLPSEPVAAKQVALVASKPPVWDPEGFGTDEYYYYYGSQALALCGGPAAEIWTKAARSVADAQSGNASERGSWDPVGVWSFLGGRVYSTAMLALMLEAPFRYTLPDVPAQDGGNRSRRR